MEPKSFKVFLPDGDPSGLRIVELVGWSGRCFVVPRTSLKAIKDRSDISGSAVYFLFGEDAETGERLVYIGESGTVQNRLTSHEAEKDYWQRAVIFADPPDRNYLESKATKLALEANRFVVKNKAQPQKEDISEFDEASNEQYFERLSTTLALLGYTIFEKPEESYADEKMYYLSGKGVDAKAKALEDGSMMVFAGSLGRIEETDSFTGWSKTARERFLAEGLLQTSKEKPESYVLTQDTLFKSPSAAAASLAGRAINGWTAWKDEQGNTLDENVRQ